MSDKLKPNWTAIPNYVLDKVLPTLSKAALKVYLAVAAKLTDTRKTVMRFHLRNCRR